MKRTLLREKIDRRNTGFFFSSQDLRQYFFSLLHARISGSLGGQRSFAVYHLVLSRHSASTGSAVVSFRARLSRVLSIIRTDRSVAPCPANRRHRTLCPLSMSRARDTVESAGHVSRERNIAARSNGRRSVNRDQETSKAGVNRAKDL